MFAMLSAFLVALVVPVQPQVSFSAGVNVHVAAPTVRFVAEPELVVVAPGVMVVPNYDREVYFANGFYWVYDGGVWFRTRNHRGGWVRVSGRYVPRGILRTPRGRYVHFHGGRPYRRMAVVRGRPGPQVVRVNGRGRMKVVKRKRHWH
jgi:hypothetical protein